MKKELRPVIEAAEMVEMAMTHFRPNVMDDAANGVFSAAQRAA